MQSPILLPIGWRDVEAGLVTVDIPRKSKIRAQI